MNRNVSRSPASLPEAMRDFCRRNLNWLLMGGLALLLLQDVFGRHGLLAMHHARQEAARMQQEIDRMSSENQRLQERVKSLKSDPETIERIAREEMGLARPGEYIFKVQPPPGGAPAAASPSSRPARH